MKIVADIQIPLIDLLFAGHQLIKKPGQEIHNKDLIDADILWVRTLTPVVPALLKDTAVKFVGSATAGIDHIQINWLDEQGIGWGYAPGANAVAVAEYVDCCIATLQSQQGLLNGHNLRAGVIGVGHVGREVAKHLSQQGFSILMNDPPRQQVDPNFHSTPLADFKNLDLICIHVSLTHEGTHPSFHLLNDNFFRQQSPGCVLINAARGAVIDTQVLMRQTHCHLCLDVWENEPHIDLALVERALIATPHIAGYSIDAKRAASLILYEKTQAFFGWNQPAPVIAPDKSSGAIYNPLAHTQEMRDCLKQATESMDGKSSIDAAFLHLRANYPWR